MHLYGLKSRTHRGQKKALGPLLLVYRLLGAAWYVCWGLNPSSLQPLNHTLSPCLFIVRDLFHAYFFEWVYAVCVAYAYASAREGVGFYGAEIAGGCDLLDTDAGNQTQVL